MKDRNVGITVLVGILALVVIAAIAAAIAFYSSGNSINTQEGTVVTPSTSTNTGSTTAFTNRTQTEGDNQDRFDEANTDYNTFAASVTASLNKMTQEIKTTWTATKADIERKRDEAKAKLDELKAQTSETTWLNLRTQVSSAVEAFETAIANAKATITIPK